MDIVIAVCISVVCVVFSCNLFSTIQRCSYYRWRFSAEQDNKTDDMEFIDLDEEE